MIKSLKSVLSAAILGLAVLGMSANSWSQTLMPVDDAAKNPDFLKFRNQLKTIIANKDAKALLAIVDKNIHMSYGDNNGIAEFKKEWKLDKPNSPLWKELNTVLSMGGQFDSQGEFMAPYVFSAWPENADGFENIAVVGKDVRIRSAPNLSAAVVAKSTYEILPVDAARNTLNDWAAVKLKNGKTGYIARQYARSPVDYRAFFSKKAGKWTLITFVAGD